MDKVIRFNTYFKYYKLLNSKYPYKKSGQQIIDLLSKLNEWDNRVEELPVQIKNRIKAEQDIVEDWNW